MLSNLLTGVAGALANTSTNNGVNLSIDTNVFQKAESAYWPMIQQRINAIPMPDLVLPSDESMYLKDNDFRVTQPADHFSFENVDNCLQIKMNKLSAKFSTGNFHAHHGIFGAHGHAEMAIDTTKLIFGFRPSTQTLADGRVVPALESCNFDFSDFDKHDLSFSVHGSFWDGFIDMFKGLFEGKVVDAIKGEVQKELTVTLVNDLNQLIANTDGLITIPHTQKWLLDLFAAEAGQVSDTSVELGVRGILYDKDEAETVPTFPEMIFKNSTVPSELQAYVSEQSVNSLFTSFLEVHPVNGWFNASAVPSTAKFQLTTGFLDKAFKGMSDYYGADQPVNVHYSLSDIKNFAVTEDAPNVGVFADLATQFYVEKADGTTELAVDLGLENFEFAGEFGVNATHLSAVVKKLKVHNVAVNSCAWGKLGTFKIQMGLNVALAVAANTIQDKIDAVALPTKIGHFEISDYIITYHDGYFGVGATPNFVAPAPPTPSGANEAGRVCVKNSAGFVLKWHFKDAYTKEESEDTEHYPIAQTKCMNIANALPHVRDGESIKTVVKASGGRQNEAEHQVVYREGSQKTVTFKCHGTTLHYSCKDEDRDYEFNEYERFAYHFAHLD
jgi:hypothetical protein